MQTTSHFVGIELNPELFSDLFVNLYSYLKKNSIENILTFQNILSIHITLYYLEANLSKTEKQKIQEKIDNLDKEIIINIGELKYFENNNNKIIGYLNGKSNVNLENIFNSFHNEFKKIKVFENNLKYVPHITLFKIKKANICEKHRENIEKIINKELIKLQNLNIGTGKIYLYKVNSEFDGEIQIKSN